MAIKQVYISDISGAPCDLHIAWRGKGYIDAAGDTDYDIVQYDVTGPELQMIVNQLLESRTNQDIVEGIIMRCKSEGGTEKEGEGRLAAKCAEAVTTKSLKLNWVKESEYWWIATFGIFCCRVHTNDTNKWMVLIDLEDTTDDFTIYNDETLRSLEEAKLHAEQQLALMIESWYRAWMEIEK